MIPLITQSYWRDEAFSLMLSQRSFGDIIVLSARDFTPPLYTLILKLWVAIFGSGEIATRLLSLACTLLLALGVFAILRRWAGVQKAYALGASLLVLLAHPLLLEYAFETRTYAMTACLATWSFYLFLTRRWGWYALVTVIGLYTHYFMVFVVVVQYLLLIVTLSYKSHSSLPTRSNMWRTFGYILAPAILYVPWTVYMLLTRDWSRGGDFWIPRPAIQELFTLPGLLVFGHDTFSGFEYDLAPFSLLVYGVILVAMISNRAKIMSVYLPLLLWALVPGVVVWVASQFITPLYLPRYLIISAPGLALLCAVSVYHLHKITRWVLLACVVASVLGYAVNADGTKDRFSLFVQTKEDLKGKITEMRSTASDDSYLLVESELDYHIAQVYWTDPSKVKIIGKTYAELPDYVGKVLIPVDAIADIRSIKKGYILHNDRSMTPLIQPR